MRKKKIKKAKKKCGYESKCKENVGMQDSTKFVTCNLSLVYKECGIIKYEYDILYAIFRKLSRFFSVSLESMRIIHAAMEEYDVKN